MVLRGSSGGKAFTVAMRETSITVRPDHDVVLAFDAGGRLYSFARSGVMRRRSLNGRILSKWPAGGGAWGRRWLEPEEADSVMDFAAAIAGRALQALDDPEWRWEPAGGRAAAGGPTTAGPPPVVAPIPAALTAVLDRAARFNSREAAVDATRFSRVYRPVGILPPDQYLALVLQVTEGCSFSSCTFCRLYDRGFRVKSPEEFRRHIAEVQEFLGLSLALRRRSIFLGAANALAVAMPRLAAFFEEVRRAFPGPAPGIHAFVDGFTGQRKSVEDYRSLAGLGLKRVTIGLESGHDPLLEFVRKPGLSADAVDTVARLKAAGVSVGVVAMIGLGGDRFAAGHVADTTRALLAMRLGAGDIIYLSDLVEVPDTDYPGLAAAQDIRPLTAGEMAAQRAAIRNALAFDGLPPKIASYDIQEFLY